MRIQNDLPGHFNSNYNRWEISVGELDLFKAKIHKLRSKISTAERHISKMQDKIEHLPRASRGKAQRAALSLQISAHTVDMEATKLKIAGMEKAVFEAGFQMVKALKQDFLTVNSKDLQPKNLIKTVPECVVTTSWLGRNITVSTKYLAHKAS